MEYQRFTQGGEKRRMDPNGDHITGQMYVQAYLQEAPRHPYPILLWHGGGMTGANWETTPDGRPGWLHYFLQAGYDVYVSDAMERGRSSYSHWPGIYKQPPVFRTLQDGWDIFRMGLPGGYATHAEDRRFFPGQQFPTEYYDAFAAEWVPRWADHEAETSHAYDQLLQTVGRCIVVGHSQGGGFAFEAARRRPQNVVGVVLVEPSGAPQGTSGPYSDLPPHLVLWGDYIDQNEGWQKNRAVVQRYTDGLEKDGVKVATWDLPRMGIHGNSHFPYMDRNSDEIAALVERWLAVHAKD
jgi:pimeloyl-ACP methyl ester carboxylesterase